MILIKNQSKHPYPSITKKSALTILCIIVAPAILLCCYLIYTNTQSNAAISENELKTYLYEFKDTVETHLQPVNDIVTTLEDNADIRSHLKNLRKGTEAQQNSPRLLKDVINSPFTYKNFFRQPAVNAVTIFYEDSLEYYSLDNAALDLALERCAELNANSRNLDNSRGQFIAPANGTAYAYWIQDFRNIYENHYYGKMIIELNPVPNNVIDNVNPGQSRYSYTLDMNRYPHLQYWLYTDQSAVIFANDNSEVGTLVHNCLPASLHNADQQLPDISSSYFIYSDSLDDWNLTLYLLVPKTSVSNWQNTVLFSAVCILVLIIYCLLAVYGTRRLTQPLRQLHDYYELSQEQSLVKPVFHPDCREISEAQELIGNKIDEIQILNSQCETLQNKLKDHEIKNLQSQINPHFLFNMLDIINWKASDTGSDDISNMVIQLSEMLHSNILFNGHQKITIRQELEYIRNYLVLQQISMAVNFQYKISADDEILDIYQIPKLCLQPIVENCIVHGFSNINYEGSILVSIWEETDGIICRIEDNGRGFNTDEVLTKDQPPSPSAKNTGSHHIALKNIADRLTILYGSKYGLTIDSIPGKGTTVTVHVPFDRCQAKQHHTRSGETDV